MTHIGLLVGGLPLRLLHSLVLRFESSAKLLFLILPKLLILLFNVVDPDHHAPAGTPRMIPFNLFSWVAFYMCPYVFKKQLSLSWLLNAWVHQCGALHQFASFFCVALGHLVFWPDSLILGFLFAPGYVGLYFLGRPFLSPWLSGGWRIWPPGLWYSCWRHQCWSLPPCPTL